MINCQKDISSNIMGLPWKILFVMGVWHIWLHRNEVTFRSGRVDNASYRRCIKESAEFFSLGINCKVQKLKSVIPVGWTKPPEGWDKLNSNGSVMGSTGKARGEGVIRNHEGVWLKGYVRPIRHIDSCRAELWALRDGLVLAKEMGLNSLVVELDALSVVLLMTNNSANKQIVLAYREAS